MTRQNSRVDGLTEGDDVYRSFVQLHFKLVVCFRLSLGFVLNSSHSHPMLLPRPTLDSLLLVYDLPVILRQKYVSLYHFQAIKIYMIKPFLFSFLCSQDAPAFIHVFLRAEPTTKTFCNLPEHFSRRVSRFRRDCREIFQLIYFSNGLLLKYENYLVNARSASNKKVSVECVPKI